MDHTTDNEAPAQAKHAGDPWMDWESRVLVEAGQRAAADAAVKREEAKWREGILRRYGRGVRIF